MFRLNRLFDWTAKKRHEVKAAPPPLSTGTFSSSWVLLQSHHHNITGEPRINDQTVEWDYYREVGHDKDRLLQLVSGTTDGTATK